MTPPEIVVEEVKVQDDIQSSIDKFIRHYFMPKTLEQSLGAAYLLFAMTLTDRPFMAGVENLPLFIAIPIAIPVVGSYLALIGGILILKKRVSRLAFIPAFLPLPIYAACLALYTWNRGGVGWAGTLAFAALSFLVADIYIKRVASRELGTG